MHVMEEGEKIETLYSIHQAPCRALLEDLLVVLVVGHHRTDLCHNLNAGSGVIASNTATSFVTSMYMPPCF